MRRLKQIGMVAAYNFRLWYKNPPHCHYVYTCVHIVLSAFRQGCPFCCGIQNDDAAYGGVLYGTFGDSNSILLTSLLLVLLFADMPFLGAGVPYYLSRIKRSTWLIGQILYISACYVFI